MRDNRAALFFIYAPRGVPESLSVVDLVRLSEHFFVDAMIVAIESNHIEVFKH